jgi:GNAT superfamily N-acetyltransferase
MTIFTSRLAQIADLPALNTLMSRAIENLQQDFLSPQQVRASHQVMGLDTQLVKDQTYFLVESESRIAGCGGWSWRATLFGGDDSIVVREPFPLDPAIDAAKVRAMYTDPDFTRRGVGAKILGLCEDAARAAGFTKVELMATRAGLPLYRASGYIEIEPYEALSREGVSLPMLRMSKSII